ncbi:alpha-L-fucosidase [Croceibacterium ferulae]|uniref:alpha-L-fucosidase n=1 Tax=Croceibacterium ferulae TaxID=1854641 RepID=UPI001F4E5C7D|nr:alpha-L-fucosidase [Croceibacterium ferulae]
MDRRTLLAGMASLPIAAQARAAGAPVAANWSSLTAGYRTPEWFRDAKFGIWAHWSAQCVPEAGDWYGRLMYQQGHPMYDHHLATYGHPADTGFMEIENRWRAEAWDPAYLVRRYKAAGAKYFMALGAHHDNLDCWDSAHHPWNTMRVGPKRDIVGTWEKLVRAEGLRFGVSNHISHAWHWWQTAYGYDAEGPRAGERYDAWTLRKEDGAGKWWDGLDPQELYTGPSMAPPAGIGSIAAMNGWHDTHSGRWMEFAPPGNPAFVAKWLLRSNDLVDRYRPDIVYLDDYGLPFGPVGMEAAAHYYNGAIARSGETDVVLTAKVLSPFQRQGLVEDVERGWSDRLRDEPWQTCTCIGDWHYNRARFLQKSYVPAKQVIQRLCDVVSKNGNLLLSIPMRGDGTIDAEEERILDGITAWMQLNGEAAIYGSRPWRIYGEGPTQVRAGMHTEGDTLFQPGDVRFTVIGDVLNAVLLDWPTAPVSIAALGSAALPAARIARVTLTDGRPVPFRRTAGGLEVTLPPAGPDEMVPVMRMEGQGLV